MTPLSDGSLFSDCRNKLTAIGGAADLALRGGMGSDEALRTILSCCRRLELALDMHERRLSREALAELGSGPYVREAEMAPSARG